MHLGIPNKNRLVLSDYCYDFLPNRYYFNTCNQYHGPSPQINCNFDRWDYIQLLDCKINNRLLSRTNIHDLYFQDLQRFLHNSQPVRILHLAPETVEQLAFVSDFSFTNKLIIEVYFETAPPISNIIEQISSQLKLHNRAHVVMSYFITDSSIEPIHLPTSQQLFYSIAYTRLDN